MRARIPNSRVNIHTGERFDLIVGDGERIEVPHGLDPLTPRQIVALREFERTMRDETIPEIERVMRMRARRAQETKHWIIW